jgi:hypothetical protein
MTDAATATARHQGAYGLAFAIEDLSDIRKWAHAHRMVMLVALDRVVNGYEFEEMVVLSPVGGRTQRIMLWRSFGTIYAQVFLARPQGFTSVPMALNWLSRDEPDVPKTVWGKLLDWARYGSMVRAARPA